MNMSVRYKTVFISDIHLGSKSSQAEPLAQLLKHIRCEQLFLVGDILDGWRLKNRWHWPDAHNQVMRRFLKAAHKGTDVVLIPGNHDEVLRQFIGLTFGGVRIRPFHEHTLVDGRTFFITHGDQFDLVVQQARLLSKIGGWGYDALIRLNRPTNRLRKWFGMRPSSLSRTIKLRVKKACTFISRFEEALAQTARRRGADGVICGHIHQPELAEIDGIAYANCGDWVESCSLLVEHFDGSLELLDGLELLAALQDDHVVDDELPQIPIDPVDFFNFVDAFGPGSPAKVEEMAR